MKSQLFDTRVINELNKIITIAIYSQNERMAIEGQNYIVFGDEGFLKLAINEAAEIVAINMGDKEILYVQKNIELFSKVLLTFLKIAKKNIAEEQKRSDFISFLEQEDSNSLKRTSWWGAYISESFDL